MAQKATNGTAKDATDKHSRLSNGDFYQSNHFYNYQNQKIMRTLNTNQLSDTVNGTKSHEWNSKRRYR
ncbi:hypothetical protein [Tamlana flava]|uniref:hypothetical protein n=1 Tax=Tamlana flava TaxID=3158572 RepID=UPI00351B0B8B